MTYLYIYVYIPHKTYRGFLWNEKRKKETTDQHTEANYNEINVQHMRRKQKEKEK